MQSIFEKLGGTYRQEGDYLLPNIEAPESPQIGIWVQRMNNIRNRVYEIGYKELIYE